MTEQEYLKNRVFTQRAYFSKKATNSKRKYYVCSIAKLSISLSITIVSLVVGTGSSSSIVVSVLSALVALIEGILLLCKYNENWITYRMTNEKLKKEEILFETMTGEYFEMNKSDAFNLFVQNIEAIIQNSNNQWESIYKKERGEN